MIFQIQFFCPWNRSPSSCSYSFFFFWDNIELGSSFNRGRLSSVAYSYGCKHLPSWIYLFCDSSCGTYSLHSASFPDDGTKTFLFFFGLKFQICSCPLIRTIGKEFAFGNILLYHLQKYLDFISSRYLCFTVSLIAFLRFLTAEFPSVYLKNHHF